MGKNIKEDPIMIEKFSQTFNKFIIDNKYTNQSFAELLGVSEACIRKYRTGLTLPSHQQMKQILQIMGIRYHKVMGFDDPESK